MICFWMNEEYFFKKFGFVTVFVCVFHILCVPVVVVVFVLSWEVTGSYVMDVL